MMTDTAALRTLAEAVASAPWPSWPIGANRDRWDYVDAADPTTILALLDKADALAALVARTEVVRSIVRALTEQGYRIVPLDSDILDLSDPASVERVRIAVDEGIRRWIDFEGEQEGYEQLAAAIIAALREPLP